MSAGSGAAVLNWPLGGSFVTSQTPDPASCSLSVVWPTGGGGAGEGHSRLTAGERGSPALRHHPFLLPWFVQVRGGRWRGSRIAHREPL